MRKTIPIPPKMRPKIDLFLQAKSDAERALVQYVQGYLDGKGFDGGYRIDLRENQFVPIGDLDGNVCPSPD